nr:PH domain-containing protein [Streptomyces sp. HNM0574]
MPFLTADRDPGPAAHTDVPLPHTDRDRWRRPYRPGPWRVGGSALLLLLSSYVLMSALVIALTGSVWGALGALVPAVVLIALALRLLRVGVWVSAYGLRLIGLFSTVTLRWSEVAAVRTVQQPVRWLGLPRTVQGQALSVGRAQGEPLRTVLTDHNADFLNRRDAFEHAADVIEAWAAESR